MIANKMFRVLLARLHSAWSVNFLMPWGYLAVDHLFSVNEPCTTCYCYIINIIYFIILHGSWPSNLTSRGRDKCYAKGPFWLCLLTVYMVPKLTSVLHLNLPLYGTSDHVITTINLLSETTAQFYLYDLKVLIISQRWYYLHCLIHRKCR